MYHIPSSSDVLAVQSVGPSHVSGNYLFRDVGKVRLWTSRDTTFAQALTEKIEMTLERIIEIVEAKIQRAISNSPKTLYHSFTPLNPLSVIYEDRIVHAMSIIVAQVLANPKIINKREFPYFTFTPLSFQTEHWRQQFRREILQKMHYFLSYGNSIPSVCTTEDIAFLNDPSFSVPLDAASLLPIKFVLMKWRLPKVRPFILNKDGNVTLKQLKYFGFSNVISPKDNDLVVYTKDDNEIVHAGVYRTNGVWSKWSKDATAFVRHELFAIPFYGVEARFLRHNGHK